MKHRGAARRGHLHLGLGLADPGLAQGFAEGNDALTEGVKVGIGYRRGSIELGRARGIEQVQQALMGPLQEGPQSATGGNSVSALGGGPPVLHSPRSDAGTSTAGALS
jgi:hypothetical protein